MWAKPPSSTASPRSFATAAYRNRLAGARIYSLHLGTLLSGTQYRGQLEKRLLSIIDGMAEEGNAIAYIDEIHNLVGAGQTGEGSLDLANLLKPYLETGSVRFIGATTHEEYNRYFSKSGALVRRFQTIDVPEPSIEETCLILEGLRTRYEAFHNITFAEGVIEHAVRRADRYINDRRLPDKAIDLIDEAAAYREVHLTARNSSRAISWTPCWPPSARSTPSAPTTTTTTPLCAISARNCFAASSGRIVPSPRSPKP